MALLDEDDMDSRTLLIFDLDGARFALDAMRVRESVSLPELTPVEEASPWIVGLFSLRGRIVPVADLHLRFAHPARRYRPTDQIVVLETDRSPMGFIVSKVCEVVDISCDAIQVPPQFAAVLPDSAHLAVGVVRVRDDLVTLLDVSRLTQLPERTDFKELERVLPFSDSSLDATPEERALFHERAVALSQAILDEDDARLGLAVVEIGGECFGVELAEVQEFCDVVGLSPIPCCPPHILGAMNLRGNLITLIDPHAAFNLPHAVTGSKAVIACLGEQVAGIAVDEVHDVVYLRKEELRPLMTVRRESCRAEIRGTAPYFGKIMTVLDLPVLMAREEWIVDEIVSFAEG